MSKSAKLFTRSVRSDLLDRVLHELLTSLNSTVSLIVRDLYENNDHDTLVDLQLDPRTYQNGEDFRSDYLATQILSKASFLNLGVNPEKVARQKLHECEARCAETNRRFRKLDSTYSGWAASIIETARCKISNVLGDFDPVEWFESGRWGPGSSTTVKGDVSSEEKFRVSRGITPPLLALVGDLLPVAYPNWFEGLDYLELVKGNKITFVPKNAKTHRPIAIEPDFNIWFQLGIGKMIRTRLKARAGIDLNTQQNNQSAARLGSIIGTLATVDLKSASDTISYELVRHLVSNDDWFQCMDLSRSRHGTLDDTTFRWEKFSSMGNGFTFELESLIFWALATSTSEYMELDPTVWVFGDDVIIPSEAVPKFIEVLEYCGFSVNTNKSFWTGKFRESCGAHYFDGLDCQPIYLKSNLLTVPDVYKAHNAIRRLAGRWNSSGYADRRFREACLLLIRGVPQSFRLGVPSGIGEVGFVLSPEDDLHDVDLSVSVSLRALSDGWEGFHVRILGERAQRATVSHRGLLLSRVFLQTFRVKTCLLGTDSPEGGNNSYPLRGRTHLLFGEVYVTKWHSPRPFG